MYPVAPLVLVFLLSGSVPLEPQANRPICQELAFLSDPTPIPQPHPAKGEKYRRPPMIAYEIQEDGSVQKVKLVRKSGIKSLDEQLLTTASSWRYQARPGCRSSKVPLAAGPVADEAAALEVAEPELSRVYGAGHIAREKPLKARLSGDMWIVSGTLRCIDSKGNPTTNNCVGGVAIAYITRADGRLLGVWHGR